MIEHAVTLIVLGLLFFAGLAADQIGRRTRIPRVTLLLACGLLAGNSGFGLLPEIVTRLYPIVSVVALSAVAFLLGSALSLQTLRRHGQTIITLSLVVVLVTQAFVAFGLWAFGVPLVLALVLGALATATDPAATFDVIEQSGKDSSFTRKLTGLVAIDDAWGLIAFSLTLVVVRLLSGQDGGTTVLATAAYELFGSIVLGFAVGLPGAMLTGRLSSGEPLRIEALGLIFLTAGLSIWLELSYLIAGMTAGAVIVNLASHHTREFHEIKHFEWPFMIIFFVLAGASLDIGALKLVGWTGAAYALLRILGRIAGGWLGGSLARTPHHERLWYGPALLPQAGVAMGMALIVAEQMPRYGDMVMALAIGTTVGFELLGPLAAGLAIAQVSRKSGRQG